MSNDLIKKPAFLKKTEVDLGVEGMEDDTIQYAKLKLAQGTTRDVPEEINSGEFFDTDGNGYRKSVTIVPVMFWKSRVLFDENLEIICRSSDSVTPNFGMVSPNCATCPKAKWTKKEDGTDEKPECILSYNYAVFTEQQLKKIEKGEQVLPLMFTGGRNALRPLKKLNAIAKKNALQSGIPLYMQKFKLKSEKQEGKFVYYTYSIQFAGLVEDETAFNYIRSMNTELLKAKSSIADNHIQEQETESKIQKETTIKDNDDKEDIPF